MGKNLEIYTSDVMYPSNNARRVDKITFVKLNLKKFKENLKLGVFKRNHLIITTEGDLYYDGKKYKYIENYPTSD